MKATAIIISLLVAPMILHAGDLSITAERKRTDVGAKTTAYKKHPEGSGLTSETSKAEEHWQYQVKVTNESMAAMPALQAQYVVFIQRQELGGKAAVADSVEKVKGEAPVAAINSHFDATFVTSDISLRSQSLMGAWHYSNGGRIKAMDNIQGIWVKLFDGDKQVGEYCNPSTLAAKYQWADLTGATQAPSK